MKEKWVWVWDWGVLEEDDVLVSENRNQPNSLIIIKIEN